MGSRILNVALTLALSGALGAVQSGCTTNAATGDRFFTTLSAADEIALGAQAQPQMVEEFGGRVSNTQLNSYINNIGRTLASKTEKSGPSLPWEFTLLDTSVINAFALPGGKVFISRGLVERMNNEAQLAGVLGHEIGHVTAQHTARRIGQATLIQGGLSIVGAAVSAGPEGGSVAEAGQLLLPALNMGGQVVILKFGRDEESQADSLGLRYMTRAGYNPSGQLQVMEILRAASGDRGGGGVEFLQTHPLPETRIKRLNDEIRATYSAQAADTSTLHQDRFQRECLSVLRRLPPPTQKAQAQSRALMAQAGVVVCACGNTH